MRTREEQIKPSGWQFQDSEGNWADTTMPKWYQIGGYKVRPLYTEETLIETERRAEQRVRAEIGEDRILLPSYQAFCNSAKGLLSGEFMIRCPDTICPECEGTGWEDEDEDLECGECDGNGTLKATTPVPWTTIKDIYRAITEEYGPKAAPTHPAGR